MASISTEIAQPICCLINRRGQVIRVALGTPHQTKIPPSELPRYGAERLCGLRCVHTCWLSPSPSDLTAMVMQRLDSLISLSLNAQGGVEQVYLAHLLPDQAQPWFLSAPLSLEAIAKQDFNDLVLGLEEEFRRAYRSLAVDDQSDRVILVAAILKQLAADVMPSSLAELAQLVESAGGKVLETIWQKRDRLHPQTVLGEGKIQEIAVLAQTQGANLVVFDRELSPAQTRNLEKLLGVRVSDRTEVILDIFAQRAQSAAGKLQVELAQLEYRLPRLVGRGQALSRLGGGIGTRGPGETKLESDRRVIQTRINHLQQQVNQLQAQRSRMRQQRLDQQIPTVAIVGYTNAGKSTLLNALTKSQAYAADQLFATLDPTTRRLNLQEYLARPDLGISTILLTDTVGFIHELPPSLMDAFRATLEEVTESDALIHLVDVSHPDWTTQVTAVEKILADLPTPVGESCLVFNKVDCLTQAELHDLQGCYPGAILISAAQRQGFVQLCYGLAHLLKDTQAWRARPHLDGES
ncbi:MAG: GTPase HflX [Pseudanabaenaceae cyanobacterium bins.68]|nr:GTPase HflX [Pseudanabaenaceae cyanobacterium bins.68]